MKVAIFGTGSYYKRFRKYFDKIQIVYVIDNDRKKQGVVLNGNHIYAPNQVDFALCDYIFILIKESREIERQLLEMNVPSEKIKTYADINSLLKRQSMVVSDDREITLQQWNEQYGAKKIIIFSHDFSRSGVPVALMNLALLLRKMNYHVLLGALGNGNLEEEFKELGIDYIMDLELYYKNTEFLKQLKKFDLAIVGSLVLSELGTMVINENISVMWWLHESELRYYKKHVLPDEGKNVYYFAVSNRVKKVFKSYYPEKKIEELYYYIPDMENEIQKKKNEKVVFALIGNVSQRKAQDILIRALEQIPQYYRKKIQVLFAGEIPSKCRSDWEKIQSQMPEVFMMGELTQKQVKELYHKIDVLICPSRDDPMPIVVTQAMQYGIPCIVSDQVGQSEFMRQGFGGMVFPNEDINELSKLMVWCIENPEQLKEKGMQTSKVYKSYFTEENMRKRLNEILLKIL